MHGLVNRAIQCFLRDTYGEDLWKTVAWEASLDTDGFEAMLAYEDRVTQSVLDAAARQLGQTGDSMLEDLGTYLVSHPNLERLRRLLRFGGVGFVDFLFSLDDLPERSRMAVPDLDLPELELCEKGGRYELLCRASHPGFARVMMGILRAMADDYGALVVLDHESRAPGLAALSIHILDQRHAAGRQFDLMGQLQ